MFGTIASKYGMTADQLDKLTRRDVHLHIDEQLNLFYACASKAELDLNKPTDRFALQESAAALNFTAGEPDPTSLASFLSLHSRPGAPRVILLDFTGYTTSNTAWNRVSGRPASIVTPPYDVDGNPGGFSDQEKANIISMWRAVAEDFAPFDVDITTEETDPNTKQPIDLTDRGQRAVIGGSSSDWYGGVAGGVAYVNTFGDPYYSPAFIFPAQLSNGTPKFVWEAISHEVGHTLGLAHDGNSAAQYYGGHENWAPIMGTGYFRSVTQWSKGEYPGANNLQDDLGTMTDPNRVMLNINQYLAYLPDDHKNDVLSATNVDDGTKYSWQTSPSDSKRRYAFTSGTIETTGDVDYFKFRGTKGKTLVTIDLVPLTSDLRARSNVDLKLALFSKGSDTPIASFDQAGDLLLGTKEICLPNENDYILAIAGVGDNAAPRIGYSNYASLGAYRLKIETPLLSAATSCDAVVPEPPVPQPPVPQPPAPQPPVPQPPAPQPPAPQPPAPQPPAPQPPAPQPPVPQPPAPQPPAPQPPAPQPPAPQPPAPQPPAPQPPAPQPPAPQPPAPQPPLDPKAFIIKEVGPGTVVRNKSGRPTQVKVILKFLDAKNKPILNKKVALQYTWTSTGFAKITRNATVVTGKTTGEITLLSPIINVQTPGGGSATLTITKASPPRGTWVGTWDTKLSKTTLTVTWKP
jgi:hypothetical protein